MESMEINAIYEGDDLEVISKQEKKDLAKELVQEIDIPDHILSALVETLEEEGVLSQEGWENKIRLEIHKLNTMMSCREVQSSKGNSQRNGELIG
jgi:DNA-binding IclR family transcriptional regulator